MGREEHSQSFLLQTLLHRFFSLCKMMAGSRHFLILYRWQLCNFKQNVCFDPPSFNWNSQLWDLFLLCLWVYWFNLQNVLSCCLTQLKAIAQLGFKWQTVEGGAFFFSLFFFFVGCRNNLADIFPLVRRLCENIWIIFPFILRVFLACIYVCFYRCMQTCISVLCRCSIPI